MSDDEYLERLKHELARIPSTGAFDDADLDDRLALLNAAGAASSRVDTLHTYQALRASGREVDPDLLFHAIAHVLDGIANDEFVYSPPAALTELSDQMAEVERAHGLEDDEFWPIGEGPPEYLELSAQYERLSAHLQAEVMRRHGEAEMAYLYEHDRREFDAWYERGRLKIHGPRPE